MSTSVIKARSRTERSAVLHSNALRGDHPTPGAHLPGSEWNYFQAQCSSFKHLFFGHALYEACRADFKWNQAAGRLKSEAGRRHGLHRLSRKEDGSLLALLCADLIAGCEDLTQRRRGSQRVLLLCVSPRFLCTAMPRFDPRLRRFNAEGAEVRREIRRGFFFSAFLCAFSASRR